MKKDEALIEGKDKPILIKWSDRAPLWRESVLPWAEKPGWNRTAVGSTLGGEAIRIMSVYLPSGQASPWHAVNWEQYFLLMEGELEVGLGPSPEKMEHVRMQRNDLLYFPVGMGFDYRNIGDGSANVMVIGGRIGGDWPKETTYRFPGEDKPFSRPW